jgi:hypothetical protein
MDNTQHAADQAKCQAATTLEAGILESATQNLAEYRREREAAGNPSEWKKPAYIARLWENRGATTIGEAMLAGMVPTEIHAILGEKYRIIKQRWSRTSRVKPAPQRRSSQLFPRTRGGCSAQWLEPQRSYSREPPGEGNTREEGIPRAVRRRQRVGPRRRRLRSRASARLCTGGRHAGLGRG